MHRLRQAGAAVCIRESHPVLSLHHAARAPGWAAGRPCSLLLPCGGQAGVGAAVSRAPRAYGPLAYTSISHTIRCYRGSFDAGQDSWDVLALGQLMVDFGCVLPDDQALALCNVPKGGRRVIDVEERASVMASLEGCESQVSAGGSLANTVVALARLGSPAVSPTKPLRVAMAGCLGGSDALGTFARAQVRQAGVEVLPVCPSGQQTGTVMVLSTPDAQRSFLSCFSNEDQVQTTPELEQAVSRSKLLVIEGYLWELPGAAEVLPRLVGLAKGMGTLVALTAGDAGVVERHGPKVLATLGAGVDIWFCNAAEAEALRQQLPKAVEQQQQGRSSWGSGISCSSSSTHAGSTSHQQQQQQVGPASTQAVAQQLAHLCPMVVVTDGSKGSYITSFGELLVVPPCWGTLPPVDTTGAGDAYAAGFLYALLAGADLRTLGLTASKTASAVIARHGAQLQPEDAAQVAQAGPVAAATGPTAPGAAVPVLSRPSPSAAATSAAATTSLGSLGGLSIPDLLNPPSWTGPDILAGPQMP